MVEYSPHQSSSATHSWIETDHNTDDMGAWSWYWPWWPQSSASVTAHCSYLKLFKYYNPITCIWRQYFTYYDGSWNIVKYLSNVWTAPGYDQQWPSPWCQTSSTMSSSPLHHCRPGPATLSILCVLCSGAVVQTGATAVNSSQQQSTAVAAPVWALPNLLIWAQLCLVIGSVN